MNGMATAAAATAPSPYVSQPRNERRPMLGSPEGDGAGGLETGSMAPPSLTLKSSFAAGRRAPPPGRQQRHQVIDLRRAQRAEGGRPAGLAAVRPPPPVRPAGA